MWCVCVMRVFFHIFLHCTWASCMPKEWQRIRRELRVHYMLYSIVHAKKRVSARILRNECLQFMVGVWLASYTHMHYICLPVYIYSFCFICFNAVQHQAYRTASSRHHTHPFHALCSIVCGSSLMEETLYAFVRCSNKPSAMCIDRGKYVTRMFEPE